MRFKPWILPAALCLLAVAAAAWQFLGGDEAPSPPPLSPVERGDAGAPDYEHALSGHSAGTGSDERSAEGDPGPEPAEEPEQPAPAMEPSIGAPPREEWFAQKYRGYTPKRLAGALEEITLRSIQLNNQCFEQEFASGRYDVVFQNAGESAGKSTTGLTRYRVDETYDGKDGRTRLHVASLSKEWYPDAFALQEEVLWLLRSTQQNPKEDE